MASAKISVQAADRETLCSRGPRQFLHSYGHTPSKYSNATTSTRSNVRFCHAVQLDPGERKDNT